MRRFLIPTVSAGLCALLVLCLLQAPTVQAHSGATGVVKERMALMKTLGGEIKKIAAMFKGEAAYDPGEIAAAARRIRRAGATGNRGCGAGELAFHGPRSHCVVGRAGANPWIRLPEACRPAM